MSATPITAGEIYPTMSLDWLERSLARHERLQRHKSATPSSIAKHAAYIADIRAEIALRKAHAPRLRALPCTYRPAATGDGIDAGLAILRNNLARLNRQQIRVVHEGRG